MYHGLNALGHAHLKWLDIKALGNRIVSEQGHRLSRVIFCTAPPRREFADAGRRNRHANYKSALQISGVIVREGTYAKGDYYCKGTCGDKFQLPEEKQSDTNLTLSVIEDLADGLVDHVYIVTGDTDQVPTLKHVQSRYPNAYRGVIFPPMRGGSSALASLATDANSRGISFDDLEWCLFPPVVGLGSQKFSRCPTEYQLPPGWMHPSKRR